MKEDGGGDKLSGKLEKHITSDLVPLAKVKEDLAQASATQFGSGWCWLAVKDGKIVIMKTPNGENPLVHSAKPILGCHVWEHTISTIATDGRTTSRRSWITWLIGTTSPKSTKWR
jgi:Fe-Mn family superoxide dismutase